MTPHARLLATPLGAAFATSTHRRARVRSVVLALGLAAALTAFWTLPLLVRLQHTRALAWGTLGTGPASALIRPLPLILIALAMLASRPVRVAPLPRTAALVARTPWIMALVVATTRSSSSPWACVGSLPIGWRTARGWRSCWRPASARVN